MISMSRSTTCRNGRASQSSPTPAGCGTRSPRCVFCSPARCGCSRCWRPRKGAPGSPPQWEKRPPTPSRRLLRGRKRCGGFLTLRRLDRGGFLLDQLDEVIDYLAILQPVVGKPADINLVGVVAAAGEADI